MLLKTRITLLVVLAVASLWLLFAAVVWQRDTTLTQRQHESLMQTQRIAWTKLQSDAVSALGDASSRLLDSPEWARAWKSDRDRMGLLTLPLTGAHPRWRVDIYERGRGLVYTSSPLLRTEPLLDTGWRERAFATQEPVTGFAQVTRDRYFWVVAQRFGEGDQPGVLAMGVEAAALLPDLAQSLGGETYLVNMRGREIASTRSGMLDHAASLGLRHAHATTLKGPGDQPLVAVVQPLAGPDARQIGALVTLHDVSAQHAADVRAGWITASAAVLVLLGLGVWMSVYLRRALAPLERSVGVLGELSRGDLDAALDEADEAQEDEAGRIARGVTALRTEMLNLQMLRDERIRIRQQQERLIRRQLKMLAESLDDNSRAEILAALEPELRTGPLREGGNELAELASILGRMSGLVTTQQTRLIGVLKELRAAMAQQEVLVSLKQELEIARSMQLSILPRSAPETDAVQVAALMIPAKEIGGDFYDYFLVDERHLAIVVADVSGKGVPAAFFMAISRTLLKTNALFLRQPGEAIARLNEQLCAENEQLMFVTVFFAVLDLASGELVYVNAGHNPPVLRSGAGEASVLPKGRNTALAVVEGLSYQEGRCKLAAGDTLVLYTDGVTEATDSAGRLFGEAALVEAVRAYEGDAGELPGAVLHAVRGFENGAPQADDITCVAVRYRGGGSSHA